MGVVLTEVAVVKNGMESGVATEGERQEEAREASHCYQYNCEMEVAEGLNQTEMQMFAGEKKGGEKEWVVQGEERKICRDYFDLDKIQKAEEIVKNL